MAGEGRVRARPGAALAGARRCVLVAASAAQTSAAIFLVLRRMRAPLIVLIVIFAVTVLGLTLIPGQDAQGRPWHMGFFDAFYVMSYTATTIGFGEIPYPFTYGQRMWVTVSIYLTVIGWAYAIGSLLALLQDRGFRRAAGRMQHFTRKVSPPARTVPADRRLRADRRAAGAFDRCAGPAVRRPRRLGRTDRRPGAGLLLRRRPGSRRGRADTGQPQRRRPGPPLPARRSPP